MKQKNFACHKGTYSCFGERNFDFEDLLNIVKTRKGTNSYTDKLLKSKKLLKEKILEEANEVVNFRDNENLKWEIADLIYFISVIMAKNRVDFSDIKKELEAEGTYKEGNGACNVTKVTAELRNVSLIPMLDNQTQQSGGFNNFQQVQDGFDNYEQQSYSNSKSLQNQPRTNNQNQQNAPGNRQGQVKKIVMAIEYKGPRTGTSTDTYVVKEKQDSNGNPIPLFNKNNKGELVNLNGMVIRDLSNSPITEKDGLFFIGDKDITSQISATIKQQMVATRTFEVIRE